MATSSVPDVPFLHNRPGESNSFFFFFSHQPTCISNLNARIAQRHAYGWALDHRIHHKYSETDSDPHNAKRGFFFAHVGWLFTTPHPEVEARRLDIDMSDLEEDPIVMWQKRFAPFFLDATTSE